MHDSQNYNPENTAVLVKSLQSATMLMQNLLSDIKDHSVALALVKAKLEALSENVELLSHVVRDGNGEGSIVTRLALIEKSLEDLEEEFHEVKDTSETAIRDIKKYVEKEKDGGKQDEDELRKLKMEKRIASLKLWGALIAAFAAMAFQVFSMIHN